MRAGCSPRRSWRSLCFVLFPLRFTFAQPETARRRGLPVRCAHQLRPAVQPGAVAAHRAAGDPLGALRPPRAALGLVAAASVVPAGRRVGADHLSAPLHRHPDRRAARLLVPLAVAGSRTQSARDVPCHRRSAPPRAGRALRGRCDRHRRAGALDRRRRPVAAVAGDLAAPGGGELRGLRSGRIPERPGRPHDAWRRARCWRLIWSAPSSTRAPGPARRRRRSR